MTTAADSDGASAGGRKIRRLAIGIVLFLVVYSAVWYLAAHQLQTRLATLLGQQTGAPTSAQCQNMDVRGFPFRIGVFCDTVKVDDTRLGASASFGALRSAAQVYRPGHAIVELDGPIEIRVSPGVSLSADWALMHASLQATFSGLSHLSATYDALAGTAILPSTGDRLGFGAKHGEVHLRQNGPDLDAAASVELLTVKLEANPSVIPPVNASADMTVTGKADLMNAGKFGPHALRGSKGEMRNLTLDLGNGMVTTASGPFSVDDRGLISGEFKVTMKDIEGWRQHLVQTFPDEDGTVMVNNIANMLTALADGKNEASVKLNVRDGTAFLAFFPIGELPQL